MGWRVFAAAVPGGSHLERGQPCQDAVAHAVVDGVLAAALCDGAGSASRSDAGAALLSQAVVDGLVARLRWGLDPRSAESAVMAAALGAVVEHARQALEARAAAELAALSDYAATLVGTIATAEGGWFFHVGDGVGVATPADAAAEAAVSLPDNGEYANETWFVTGPAWRSRLRLLRFDGPLRHVVLMSDGAQAFAMDKGGRALFPPFFGPVERYLSGVQAEEGNRALAATLGDARTHAITGDDKALLIALRG